MYAGLTLTAASGRLAGAHQKIDRAARRHLERLLAEGVDFPATRAILRFEGRDGPDGIKRKSTSQDEPRHFISPFDAGDTMLLRLIDEHYQNLVMALRNQDAVVAGFEAAWLAHAIVDGLTPAHHYPYEEKLEALKGGAGISASRTIRERLIMPGANNREALRNNWRLWGPKGLLTTHLAFEWGVSSILLPMRLGDRTAPSEAELIEIRRLPVARYFSRTAKEVAVLGIYDSFYRHGWTSRLARTVRRQLVPSLVKSVTLVWYKAAYEASAQSIGRTDKKLTRRKRRMAGTVK